MLNANSNGWATKLTNKLSIFTIYSKNEERKVGSFI